MSTMFQSRGAACRSQAPGYASYIHWDAICEEVNDTTVRHILQANGVEVTGQQEATLIQYIMMHAKILFALADITDELHLTLNLAALQLTDDYLPIVWDAAQCRAKSLSGAPKCHRALDWFSPRFFPTPRKHRSWIENFCRAQWQFLAPVFTDSEIVYPLSNDCPLPFTYYNDESSAGANSLLAKAEIHPSHWKTIRLDTESDCSSGSGVSVAIKKITKQHEATDKWVQVEVAALELVRSLHHPHLINFLTSYRQAGNHYLIFEWANGGDLSHFWRTTSPKPLGPEDPSHRQTIIWAINQMAGLAAGLHKLHTEDKYGVHCRHGDLKPPNIVRSTTHRDPSSKPHGRLLITDMGVAKVNDKATYVGRSSGNLKATIRYQSPEFMFRLNPDSPTSRAYDMWSMGCTLLEFIIWLLYGPKSLEVFNNSFPNTTFFSGDVRGGILLNSAVKHWVDHMQTGALSTEAAYCVSDALRDILKFILKRMLIQDVRPELEPQLEKNKAPRIVVEAPDDDKPLALHHKKRAVSGELLELLEAARNKNNMSYFLREAADVQDNLLPPSPPRRSTSPPLPRNSLEPSALGSLLVPVIDVQETASMLTWDQLRPKFADLPQGRAHPDHPYVTDYLRDSWDAIPDNELALQLFPEIELRDVVPTKYESALTASKALCSHCMDENFGIFSLRFVCEETVDTLKARETDCGVCWMLRRHAIKHQPHQEKVKFLRSGSYLIQSTLEGGIPDKTVFSLVVGPGITAAPKDLQRSFPRLPRVVTEPGRERAGKPKPRPKFTITGDEAMFIIMKKWIADCDKRHTINNKDQSNCNPNREGIRPPTRLIYVGKRKENMRIHLVRGQAQDSRLKYVALSHRWGYRSSDEEWTNPDGSIKSFCTTDDNFDEFKDPTRGIDFAALPKTFRDAVEVTRGLGIEYLWIDSLCIIQNQPDNADFNRESRRMGDVYGGAYCTIASTGAEGTVDGFLNERKDRSAVCINTTRQTVGAGNPGSTTTKPCTVYICDAIDDFQKDVDGADMATRGWIFQERALSRRTLHFAKSQVYWECGAGVCCQTMTRMFNRRATFMSDPDFPSQAGKYGKGMKIRFYETLFQHYSTLKFSVMTNRAVAMNGLEDKILTTFQTNGAYGVMHGEFLHRTLLWQRRDRLPAGAMAQISFGANNPTPPSWSWMSVSGKITYLPVEFDTIDWDIELLSPFRNVDSTKLGVVADNELTPIEAPAHDIKLNPIDAIALELFLDREESLLGVRGLKCVVMGSAKKPSLRGGPPRLPVLLIAPKATLRGDTGDLHYERVGVGKLYPNEINEERCIVQIS